MYPKNHKNYINELNVKQSYRVFRTENMLYNSLYKRLYFSKCLSDILQFLTENYIYFI